MLLLFPTYPLQCPLHGRPVDMAMLVRKAGMAQRDAESVVEA